jgi:hypothetical protein
MALLVAGFVALGLYYGDTTPIFEGPGEPWHYLRVESMAGERSSPALVELRAAKRRGIEDTEPPLYYWLGAWLLQDVDISQDNTSYALNPWVVLGDPTSTGNRNAVVRLKQDDPPYEGVSAAVHRLRIWGVLFSALTLCVIYLTARLVAPARRDIAVGAAAVAGLTPGFLFHSALVHNMVLAVLAVTSALCLAACARHRPNSVTTAVGLGVVCGLATLVSRAAVLAMALVPIAYVLPSGVSGERKHARLAWRQMAVSLGIALVVCGWWLLPDIAGLLGASSPTNDLALRADATPLGILRGLLASYWATFGWLNVPAEPWVYSIIAVLSVVSLGGGLLMLLRLRWIGLSTHQRTRRVLPLPVAWLILVTLGIIWRSQLRFWPQGPQLYLAIGPISFLLYGGLSAWASRQRHLLAAALTAVLAGVSLLAPTHFIAPAYAQPERIQMGSLPHEMRALDLAFGDDLFLLGYSMEQDSVTIGRPVQVRLYWVARKRILHDYTFSVFLLGREEALVGTVNSYPGRGNYATRLWLPGEVVMDDYWVPVASTAQAPTGGSLRVSVYQQPGAAPIEAVDLHGRSAGGAPQIASVRLAAPYRLIYEPTYQASASFGERVALTGYSIFPQNPAAGEEWQIGLVWRPLRRMSSDYTVFAHLVDDRGKVIAQADGPPVEGGYPTSLWRVGEQILDVHTMRLPKTVPSGHYGVLVGWYALETGERLTLDGADPAVSHAALGPFYFDVDRIPEPKGAGDEPGR